MLEDSIVDLQATSIHPSYVPFNDPLEQLSQSMDFGSPKIYPTFAARVILMT